MPPKATLTFYGGAGEVTGANILFSYTSQEGATTRILFDCGLIQGAVVYDERNSQPFAYDVTSIDALFVSHGHIDHSGRIPKLVKEGFRGVIYSTPPTRAIGELMVVDSRGVMMKELKRRNIPLLYDETDIGHTMARWSSIEYHEEVSVGPITARLLRAGHVLGSAMVEITYPWVGGTRRKLVYTGDLGDPHSLLLEEAESLDNEPDYVIIESVYGDRVHEGRDVRAHRLEDAIEDTVRRGGVLMMPAFSVEKTQELLFEMNEMVEHGRIPPVPVFLDSPLAIKVTRVYGRFKKYFNKDVRDIIAAGDDVFKFARLTLSLSTEQSIAINDEPLPKIIIAGSGMSNGGRIVHHEKRYLPDPKSTLLFTGYQSPRSMGRRIQEGANEVVIHGESIPVRARIVTIGGYSAHRDSDNLLEFIHTAGDTVREVFVALGEPSSSRYLAQRMRDYLGIKAIVPEREKEIILT
ncbi:MAG: MBL fold metallo-hydrolase [Candidatus Vogelbacteria bacterium]|nr:MBL fold metallo-hydrolase [Candidatus Vogelbacteria bacterium]